MEHSEEYVCGQGWRVAQHDGGDYLNPHAQWLNDRMQWQDRSPSVVGTPFLAGTIYRVPDASQEVVIDDRWAAVWPRRLVMGRDNTTDKWRGPYELGYVVSRRDHVGARYGMTNGFLWHYCRPCNLGEIAKYKERKRRSETQSADVPVATAIGCTTGRVVTDTSPVIYIGEGYRMATDQDEWRQDRERWSDADRQWIPVGGEAGITLPDQRYRVPVDVAPRCADTWQRPIVMARLDQRWHAAVLIRVDNDTPRYRVCIPGWRGVPRGVCWVDECRFPYQGELSTAYMQAVRHAYMFMFPQT